ncbi:F-box protein [Aspergillus rambellii]|uniref:F-box protein n=1 Tax=Aspergillus rambellii TaxID=308745 RepID=A0A0F8W6F0_9EURO|nr:F-box protein [Aspergillus rambellii]
MEDNAELQSFRRQWREEVARKSKPGRSEPSQAKSSKLSAAHHRQFPPTLHEAFGRNEEDDEVTAPQTQDAIVQELGHLALSKPDDEDAFHSPAPRAEPKSALEHFERAVEKEAEGNLGDSLQHYRKAYRLDAAVDKEYRNKHFASAWKKAPQNAAPKDPASAISSDEAISLPTAELIASFSNLPILQAEPLVEGTPPPPCPIAHVPSEVIVEILKHVALMDPASFCRMSLVCKRFAYHFSHEQHIWKRLCQGAEFGFKAMQYSFACDIHGLPEYTLAPRYTPFPTTTPVQIPETLSSWSEVFQTFPRVRFTGIYISTVNYTRPGATSGFQNTSWNSPIHIVTYYRYIRFYPDGTVIYLLTTEEPVDVVPHINKENVKTARATSHKQHQRNLSDVGASVSGAPDPIPHVVMGALKRAQWGRWRLAKPETASDSADESEQIESISDYYSFPTKDKAAASPDPRDLVIETEGVGGPKYIYVLHLSLRSTNIRANNTNPSLPNPSRNTKMVWKGYWSYDKLTDDWAEFGLKNDRAFVFRRVRGWGMK